MTSVAALLVALVALLHVGFAVLEMLLWDKPTGRRVFGTSREQAAETKVLAANQGLYNLFLAAGLVWALWLGPAAAGRPIAIFFTGCVVVAGLFGAATVSRSILFVQALPGALAMAAVLAV